MAAINGKEYINRIDRLNTNIWINGSRLNKRVSKHPAFKGILESQSKLFDLQYEKDKSDFMLFKSLRSGNLVSTSFLEPKTKEDLEKRRRTIQERAKAHAGMLGRAPDYMNTILMSFYAASPLFKHQSSSSKKNIEKFYELCSENDLTMTHTFIQPQVDRSSIYTEDPTNIISAQMIEKNNDGIVIHGARLLATQGGITDEIVVYPSGAFMIDEKYAYAFSIPSDTPGLKFICRESFSYDDSSYNHPFGSRFDEMDTIVVFDHVLVPWDRVFLHGSLELSNLIYSESSFFPHTVHQVLSKNIIKTEFFLGVIQLIVDTINIGEYLHVKEKVSEVIVALEILKGLLDSSELHAKIDQWGSMTPDPNPLITAINYFPKIYPRFTEIIRLLGASGLASIPKEEDFASHISNDLIQYLQSAKYNAYNRVKLFRAAWDMCMSAFGSRQTLYEQFFFGDPVRQSANLYLQYDRSKQVEFAKQFLGLD